MPAVRTGWSLGIELTIRRLAAHMEPLASVWQTVIGWC
jgi:hypothetical protein